MVATAVTYNAFLRTNLRNRYTEPAGPAGSVYRLRKFVRKNALYVTAVATITGFLVACLVVSTAYFIRAQRTGDRVLRASYGANIAAASSDLEHGDLAQAGRRLDSCARRMRGWEWWYVNA